MASGYPYAVPHPQPPDERPELPDGVDPWPRWPLWYALAAPAAGFVVAVLALVVLGAVVAIGGGRVHGDSVVLTDVGTLLQDGIFVLTAVWFASRTAKPRAWMFGLTRRPLVRTVGWTVIGFVTYWLLAAIYSAAVNPKGKQSVTEDLGANKSTVALVAGAVLVIVVAPICEELFFRGFLYRVLRGRFSIWIAAAIDGVFFGAIHYTGASTLSILPVLALLGFVFCLVYEKTGTLFATIALHATNNALAYGTSTHHGGPVATVLGVAMVAACIAAVAAFPVRGPART